jgi:hypothetical protein
MAGKKFSKWNVKKEIMSESASWRMSLFSFREMKKISCRLNLALIFMFLCIKTKERKNFYNESTAFLIAFICSGEVPQHPPIIFAPAAIKAGTNLAILSGVSG